MPAVTFAPNDDTPIDPINPTMDGEEDDALWATPLAQVEGTQEYAVPPSTAEEWLEQEITPSHLQGLHVLATVPPEHKTGVQHIQALWAEAAAQMPEGSVDYIDWDCRMLPGLVSTPYHQAVWGVLDASPDFPPDCRFLRFSYPPDDMDSFIREASNNPTTNTDKHGTATIMAMDEDTDRSSPASSLPITLCYPWLALRSAPPLASPPPAGGEARLGL
jgi:hypothetical protein